MGLGLCLHPAYPLRVKQAQPGLDGFYNALRET